MNNVYSDDPKAGQGISKKPKWVYGLYFKFLAYCFYATKKSRPILPALILFIRCMFQVGGFPVRNRNANYRRTAAQPLGFNATWIRSLKSIKW